MFAKLPNRLTLCLGLALACAHAVAQERSGSFERVLDVDRPIALDVETGRGQISVRSGPAGRVRVSGEIEVRPGGGGFWIFRRRSSRLSAEDAEELVRAFESDPPVELAGDRLRVGYDYPDWHGNYSISYEIEVPAGTDVRSETGSGSQMLAGLDGRIEAAAGSGSLSLTALSGSIVARTGSGRIRATAIAGDFDGSAGSGSIVLEQTEGGDVRVATGSGRIELAGIDGGLTARTGSGGITAAGRPAAPWHLQTGSGRISLRLPPDAAFDLNAHTGSGGISTDHPMTIQGSIERGRLSGQVRGGGPLISARSGSGGISIEQGAVAR